MHKCWASYPNNYAQQLMKNSEHAMFLVNKNPSSLQKLILPCLIVRGCEVFGCLELYEEVNIFPRIFKMSGGVKNKMILRSSGNLTLKWGIVNWFKGRGTYIFVLSVVLWSLVYLECSLNSILPEFHFLCLLICFICSLGFSVHITAEKSFLVCYLLEFSF